MKGQILYTRATVAADADALEAFYREDATEKPELPLGGEGFVAKLAGDIAAHMAVRRDERVLWIESLHVGSRYRRKRVATLFLQEVSRLASEEGHHRLAIRNSCFLLRFFVEHGFVQRADLLGKMIAVHEKPTGVVSL